MLRSVRLFILFFFCSVNALCQPGEFSTGFYQSSDFVIYAERIHADTFEAPVIDYYLDPSFFGRGKVNRDSLAKAALHQMRQDDSAQVHAEQMKRIADLKQMNKELRKKHKKTALLNPEYPQRVFFTIKVICYNFIIREVYKNCFDISHTLGQAQLSSRDTISFLLLYDKLDSTQRKYLNSGFEMVIYFNQSYYNENIVGPFKTRDYEKFYHDHRIYWVDPERMEKPSSQLIEK